MKKNNKGYTLIELIAAIMLLGIILTIATTAVVTQLNKNRRKTVLTSARSYVTAINDNNYINDADKIITSGTVAQINPKVKKSISGQMPDRGNVTVNTTTKEVSSATLYIDKYVITYNGTKFTITSQ